MNLSDFKTEPSWSDFSQLFQSIDTEDWKYFDGVLIPIKNLHHTYLCDNEFEFIDYFKTNKPVANEIVKSKYVEWRILFLNFLLDIKELVPLYFPKIRYCISNFRKSLFERNTQTKLTNEWNMSELAFSSINIDFRLSSSEFNFICELLGNDKTRFCLSSIEIHLNSLSECIILLDLFLGCPELSYICLIYYDKDEKWETNEEVIRNFRKSYGFIWEIDIIKA